MKNEAVGFKLTLDIPKDIDKRINEVEAKIQQLEQQARDSSDKINKSFMSIGKVGLKDLSDKIALINAELSQLGAGNNNISIVNSFNNVTEATNTMASSVVGAANAVNQMGTSGSSSLEQLRAKISNIDALIEKFKHDPKISNKESQIVLKAMLNDYQKLLYAQQEYARQMSLLNAKSIEENKIAKQANKNQTEAQLITLRKEEQQLRLNDLAWRNYSKAMLMSENTPKARIKMIERLKSVLVELSRDEKGYASEIQLVTEKIKQLERENENLEKTTERVSRSHNKLLNTGMQLRRALTLVFSVSQVTKYIRKVVEVRGLFELQNKALQAIIQNKDEANKLFGQITELAVRSPFQLKELVTYTKQLAAYRVETEKLYDTTKMLADVSAGLGVDMNRLILAFGQVKAANYLRGQELRQFSEAGINILGELAKYFTELEGKAVSVGEVFNRVSKRMVKFSDVEEIFKRLTKEGGIFFNMQEIQAETVAGMLSNLKDSIDIMINEIGKKNEGIIKGFLNFQKTLIENYEILETVIAAVTAAFAIYVIQGAAATMTNIQLAKSATEAASAELALRKAQGVGVNVLSKFLDGLKKVGVFLKGHPIFIIAMAIGAIIKTLSTLNRKVEESKEKYEVLSNKTYELKDNFNSIVNSLKEQTTLYDKANKEMEGLKEGTEDYVDASKKANDAEEKRTVSLQKLKTQFPDVYKEYVNQGENLDNLTKIQEKYNEQLQRTLDLNFALQSRETLFNDGLIKTLSKFGSMQKELDSKTSLLQGGILNITRQIEQAYKDNPKVLDKLRDDISQAKDVYEEAEILDKFLNQQVYNEKNKKAKDIYSGNKFADFKDAKDKVDDFLVYYRGTEHSLKDELDFLIDETIAQADALDKDDFKKKSEEQKKAAIEAVTEVVKAIPNINEKFIQDLINKKFKEELDIELNFSGITKQLQYQQKRINEYIEKNQNIKGKVDLIQPNEIPNEYFDALKKKYDGLIKTLKQYEDASVSLEGEIDMNTGAAIENQKAHDESIKTMREERDAILLLGKAFGFDFDSTQTKKENKTQLDIFKEKLELLKKINKAYEKYRAMNDKETSNAKAVKDFEDEIANLGLTDFVATMTFDTQGLIDGIEQLSQQVSDEIAKEGSKEANVYKVQVQTELDKAKLDLIKTDIQTAFDDFDISYDLIKSGFGEDFARILGIDFIDSIDKLRTKLEGIIEPIIGSKNADKMMQDINKMIAEREKKQYEERIARFKKYLKDTVDEIAGVQNSGALDIKFANELFDQGLIDVEQYTKALKNIVSDVNQEISKIEVEKFKDSAQYIMAMGDMSMYSKKELMKLRDELEKLVAKSAGNMDASDLKVYTDAIEKVNEELNKVKNPFDETFISKINKLTKYQKDYNNELANYNSWVKKQEDADEALAVAKEDLRVAEENAIKNGGEDNAAMISDLKEEINLQTNNLQEANNQVNISKSKLSGISSMITKITGGASGTMFIVDAIIKGIYKTIKAIVDMFYEIKDLADTFGAETDEGKWKSAELAFQGIGEMNDKVMSTWEKFKGGDLLGSFVDSIGAVFAVIKAANRVIDNEQETLIQNQLDRVKKLEKGYEDLEQAINDAMTIGSTNSAYNAAQASLQQRINAYKSAIAAEEDKKDTDKDRLEEFTDNVRDLEKQKKELNEQKIDMFGGFENFEAMKDFAQELADAWLESFKEQGDGLDVLNEKWNEYFENIVAKQLMMRGIDIYLKDVMQNLNNMLSDGMFDTQEAQDLRKQIDEVMPQLNEFWKGIAESFDLGLTQSGGDMSDLQRGIQSVTETTAQALEALLNSVRFFTADSNLQLNKIVNILMGLNGYTSPMLTELRTQTNIINDINNKLSSIIKEGHAEGGAGVKTFIN